MSSNGKAGAARIAASALAILALGLVVLAGVLWLKDRPPQSPPAVPAASADPAEPPVADAAPVEKDDVEGVYRVGPAEKFKKISEVVGRLNPGDVVELTGNITDSFTLEKHGFHDSRITIRGVTRMENSRLVRPTITVAAGSRRGINCSGDWNVLENLDLTGASGNGAPYATISFDCNNLVIRNCRFHHNFQAIHSWPASGSGGDIVIEFCEFEANGAATGWAVYLYALTPGAKATVQHCFFHDATGGHFIKSRYPRNVIRYNWFENQYHSAIKIINEHIGRGRRPDPPENLRPMHSDIVGNVFLQGWSPGPQADILQLGGEEEASPGTEGDFNISHNLFLVSRNDASVVRLHGNVDRLNLYNNIFLGRGISGYKLHERGTTWDDPLSKAFEEKRGSPDPVIAGANNWICLKATDIPGELTGSLRGANPAFENLLDYAFRPRSGSPLVAAGLTPLPRGRATTLAAGFEPNRGIPADIDHRERRKPAVPSIGPFEVAGD